MLAVDSRTRPVSRRPGRGTLTAVPSAPVGTLRPPRSRPSGKMPAHPHSSANLHSSSAAAVALPLSPPRVRPLSPSTYRRRRALAAGAVVAVSALATIVLGALGGGSLTAPERPLPADAGRTYVVQPGDTFWSIAREVEPEGDVRPVVDRLVAEHGGATLVVGEPIRLPLRA